MSTTQPESPRRWRPINRVQRRILGVLVEKSKTTPDVYPMTVNSITTGANQKSNRYPLMALEPDEVQIALDQLRLMGAVVEIHGDGRVPKYKHLLYEWFGAEKGELAIMAELLLRGQQTQGELRARAARMDDIADLTALRPLVDSLVRKNLIIELTPAGRGQVVSHNLYQPEELDKVRSAVGAMEGVDEGDEAFSGDGDPQPSPAPSGHSAMTRGPSMLGAVDLASLVERIKAIEEQMKELKLRLDRIES